MGNRSARRSKFGLPFALFFLAFAVALTACQSSDGSEEEATFGGTETPADDEAQDSEEDTSTTTEATTTTTVEESTTSSSLTAEQEAFVANVAEADRLMETIRDYREALHDCTSDHRGCTFAFTDFLTERAAVDMTRFVEERMESGLHYDNEGDESFFVQRIVGVGGSSEVWICVSPSVTEYGVDEDGNRVDVRELDERDELQVYEVVEQGDGGLLINQVLVLDQDGDTKPEGGTCDSYREWPPPLPQS